MTATTESASERTEPRPVQHVDGARGTDPNERRVLGYRRQRFEARRVRRLVRHIDPWSVLKLSLLMALCLWIVVMIASVIIWSVANSTGALSSLEDFFNDSLQLEDFKLSGDVLFRQFGLVSLLISLGLAAAGVVGTLVFNLVSDIIGGIWISVIEEETARPVGVRPAAWSADEVPPEGLETRSPQG
ncbi:MAG: DUF3566 domain-containing protein [Microthrixaceae bacterium]